MNDNETKGPLSGILVADFTLVISGPFCTQILCDNGARVIKIEQPKVGDITRHCGVFVDKTLAKDFAAFNGGKESVEADLKNPEHLKLVRNIIRKADVLVENFRPGVMARLGLSYEEVKKINPKIVYASISGFGQDGPLHDKPAYDEIVQADSGFMSITGFPGNRATRAGISLGDLNAGLHCYAAIMTALYARAKTGEGCHVDTSMLDSMVDLLAESVGEYFATRVTPQKQGNDNPSVTPFSSFATKDQEIVICVASVSLWKTLLKVIGKEDWLSRPDFKFPEEVHKNRAVFRQELEKALTEHASSYWLDKMREAGLPCSKINTIAEMTEMEQVKVRKMIITSGNGTFSGNSIKLSNYPAIQERRRAPEIGDSNEKIRKEFGE